MEVSLLGRIDRLTKVPTLAIVTSVGPLCRCLAADLDVLNRRRDVSQANDGWHVVEAAQANCDVIVEQLQRVFQKGDREAEHTKAGEQSRVHRVEYVIGTQAIPGRSGRKPP
eukprot:scaffold14305_cov61-Phaeocystis_antarctica.AAC.1